MADKMKLIDFVAKVDSEGGLYDAVAGYGLGTNDINREDDPIFFSMLEKFEKKANELSDIEFEMIHYMNKIEDDHYMDMDTEDE